MEIKKEEDLVVVMGDFNAKIGKDNNGDEHKLSEMIESRDMFADSWSVFESITEGCVTP